MFYHNLINLGLIWFQPLIWIFWLNFTILLQPHQFICVYHSVVCVHLCMSVCLSGCVCFVLLCNLFLAVNFLPLCGWIIDYISHICKNLLCVIVVLVHICAGEGRWMCLFCTINILECCCHPFIAVRFFLHNGWIVVCTIKRFSEFCIFSYFPFISYVCHFSPRRSQVWLFFPPDPLTYLNHVHDFFCVCSHS